MKKKSSQKLSLAKVRIAGLSKHNQQMIKAGSPPTSATLDSFTRNIVKTLLCLPPTSHILH